MAGGDSTRFWPLENKVLFSFLGKPLILNQVEEIAPYSENIFIIAHKSNAVAIKRLIDNASLPLNVDIVIQKDDAGGQAGAISSVKNLVKGEALVVNANDVVDYSILEKIAAFSHEQNKLVLFGKKHNEFFSGGYFKFNNDKEVVEVVEKPKKDDLPSNVVKLVLDYVSDFSILASAVDAVRTKKDDHYEQALNHILKSEIKRTHLIYEGDWETLKFSWNVLTMMKSSLAGIKKTVIAKSAKISKKSEIQGLVVIGENVVVGDFAKIVGPTYIGDNTVIGDFSLIRESQIDEDCLVGSYTEVARSYIGNKVFLHRNYVGDSVLSDEVTMGAQALTANLRFDNETVGSYLGDDKVDTYLSKLGAIVGREVKIGVNATITPGVKIGKKTWVGPGEIVTYDLDEKTYLSGGEEKINLNI